MRGAAVLLLVLAAGLAGCLRSDLEENFIRIVGIDVAAPRVSSGTVLLLVNVTLDNGQGRSGPVEVVAKAFATDTGLLEATNRTAPGAIAKDKSVAVPIGLEVPRRAGYRIEVQVHEDQRLVQQGQVTASNVGALPTNLFDTGLDIGQMDFLVRNVSGNRVDIEAAIHVTNEAGQVQRPLRMVVKAREVTTGLLSDEASAMVEGVRPEETHVVPLRLNVPNGYNYEVEATLWDGNITVGRGTGKVQLLPNFTKDKSQEVVVTRPEITDFVRDENAQLREQLRQRPQGAQATPGFEAIAAVAAIAGLAVVFGRRRHG